MLERTQTERPLDSKGREKTPQEAAGRVLCNIGSGEALYTVVTKGGF